MIGYIMTRLLSSYRSVSIPKPAKTRRNKSKNDRSLVGNVHEAKRHRSLMVPAFPQIVNDCCFQANHCTVQWNRTKEERKGAQGLTVSPVFIHDSDGTSMSAHLLIGFQKTEVVVDVGTSDPMHRCQENSSKTRAPCIC